MFRSDMGEIGGRGVKIRNPVFSLVEAIRISFPPPRL